MDADTFRAFAYEDMPTATPSTSPPTRRSSSIARSIRRNPFRSLLTSTSSRKAASNIEEHPLAVISNNQAAPVSKAKHSSTTSTNDGATSATCFQTETTNTSNTEVGSPIKLSHSANTTTSNPTISINSSASSLTLPTKNHTTSPTPNCRICHSSPCSCPSSTPTNPTASTSALNRLLTIPAATLLTTLLKHQLQLPTKDLILATGNPLGMLLPTNKKFILLNGKIRHGRVIEGRVVQVTPEVFERHMDGEYYKAFAGGVEEVEYALTEPMSGVREADGPRLTVEEVRAGVVKEVREAEEEVVEGVVGAVVDEAVACAVQGLELAVEVIVGVLVEEAVLSSVKWPSLLKLRGLNDRYMA